MKNNIPTILTAVAVAGAVSVVFNMYLTTTTVENEEMTSLQKKQLCSKHFDDMREQIEIYHGIDATYELRSAFFSEKYNSCLYYYAYSQAGFTWLNIRDYFTNEIIYASDRYEYFEASTKEDEFESKLFEYQ